MSTQSSCRSSAPNLAFLARPGVLTQACRCDRSTVGCKCQNGHSHHSPQYAFAHCSFLMMVGDLETDLFHEPPQTATSPPGPAMRSGEFSRGRIACLLVPAVRARPLPSAVPLPWCLRRGWPSASWNFQLTVLVVGLACRVAVFGMLIGGFTFGLIVGSLGEMARKSNPGEVRRHCLSLRSHCHSLNEWCLSFWCCSHIAPSASATSRPTWLGAGSART